MSDVAVVGAGAVGLTLAGRLAQHGVSVDLFEAEPRRERIGSRAICMQRETLEIWARLGIGQAVADRGIQWRVGPDLLPRPPAVRGPSPRGTTSTSRRS